MWKYLNNQSIKYCKSKGQILFKLVKNWQKSLNNKSAMESNLNSVDVCSDLTLDFFQLLIFICQFLL